VIGKTDAQGLARIEIALPSLDRLPRCDYNADHHDAPQMGALNSLWSGLFIMASTPDDMSFVHSSWTKGSNPGGFSFRMNTTLRLSWRIRSWIVPSFEPERRCT